jgi:hypothetical protein
MRLCQLERLMGLDQGSKVVAWSFKAGGLMERQSDE